MIVWQGWVWHTDTGRMDLLIRRAAIFLALLAALVALVACSRDCTYPTHECDPGRYPVLVPMSDGTCGQGCREVGR